MPYAILIFEGQDGFAKREAADKEAFWASRAAYSQALAQAKVMVGRAGLLPPDDAVRRFLLGRAGEIRAS